MTRVEYTVCDDCGNQMHYDTPYMIERPGMVPTLSDPGDPLHACSTACLVRLATELHYRNAHPLEDRR